MKFNLNQLNFEFSGENLPEIQMQCIQSDDELGVYKITFDWQTETEPTPIKLSFFHVCKDLYTHMKPDLYRMHNVPWGSAKEFESRLASWMPIEQYVSGKEENRLTVAVGDVKSHLRLNTFVELPGFALRSDITFFVSPTSPIAHYETLLRIDAREMKYYDALDAAMQWYVSLGYKNEHVPAAAYDSAYSTWYAYLQDITAKDILKECRLAKKAGMDTVIVDDGWQNEGLVRDYSGCGDWKPAKSRFPNMRKFVDDVHAIGMKVMLWFSVPFMGYDAENFKRFEPMCLHKLDGIRAAVLDPRYKEVREFLVGKYVHAVCEWDLDGLKLDFIDRFKYNGIVEDAMDYSTIEDATEQLLREITTALHAVKNDILIEFRQPYMGPVITTYGNMIRVWDCPLDPIVNRVGITDLRMLTSNCAVHSDMIYWDNSDTAVSVATHLYSALFGVPQISVRMAEITAEQRKVLSSFLAFRNAHKQTLMHGNFRADGINANYAYTETTLDGERIALYTTTAVICLDADIEKTHVINLSGKDEVFVTGARENVKYAIFDCTGKCISRMRKLKKTESVICVPHAGRICFVKE